MSSSDGPLFDGFQSIPNIILLKLKGSHHWTMAASSSRWLLSPFDMTLLVLDSFLTGIGKMYRLILNISCPRPRIKQFSGKPWSLSAVNGISRPQSGIHTDISNSNSGYFFPPNLLTFFCITSLSPFFRIENPGLKDTGYTGLHYPIIIHFLYPTLFTQQS